MKRNLPLIVLIFFLGFILTACGGNIGSDLIDDGTPDPNITLTVTAHPENSLMAEAHVTVTENAVVSVEFTSAETEIHKTAESNSGTEHDITVIGMRSETVYTLTAVATLTNSSTVRSQPVTFTTGQLPGTPPIITLEASNGTGEGGITFLGVMSDPSRYWGVDEAGEIVWFLHGDYTTAGSPWVREIEPGVLMAVFQGSTEIITTTGEYIETYSVGQWHHDITVLPNGNTLMLVFESRDIGGGESLTGDAIIEKNAAGEIVWAWSCFDHLDTTRVLDSADPRTGAIDWSHSNALNYIADEDVILLSARNQSWVLKIDHSKAADDDNVIWIMGDPVDTAPDYRYKERFLTLASGAWMVNQHAPMMTKNGDILIYDNRTKSLGSSDVSRAVRFAIDESTMTATQIWEAIAPKFTGSFGDVDELSGGNVLMCAGGPDSGSAPDTSAYIVEASGETGDILWSISVENDKIYRAERMTWSRFLNYDQISQSTLNK